MKSILWLCYGYHSISFFPTEDIGYLKTSLPGVSHPIPKVVLTLVDKRVRKPLGLTERAEILASTSVLFRSRAC